LIWSNFWTISAYFSKLRPLEVAFSDAGRVNVQRADLAKNILVVNGPNLNLLGTREPDRYGSVTLPAIEQRLDESARHAGAALACFQSNSESEIVERIQRAAPEAVDFILINPAAYTHTSVAIRDALAAVRIPFIEIHLSNIHAREPFRKRSYLSDLALGVVSGLGAKGYSLALAYALEYTGKD
jgi:3-dehydroquinate dehydratase-2